MGITVRELITKLNVDSGKALDDLSRFGLAVNGAKAALGLLAGAFDAAKQVAFGFVAQQTEAADQIAKTARTMGLQGQELQRLTFAAERSGVPMQNLIKSSQNLARNLRDAATGGGAPFVLALQEVGLTTRDLIGLKFEEKIGLIGERLQELPTMAMRVAASQKLLGEEAGPKFASFLMEGRAGIKALGDEAERLGIVIGEDGLAAAEAYQDTLTDLNAVFTGIKRTVGVELAPEMNKFLKRIRELIVRNKEVVKTNLLRFFKKVSELVIEAAENFSKFVDNITDLLDLGAQIARFFSRMIGLVGGLENAIKLAAVAWGTYKIAQAAALGPIGIAVALVGGLAAAFLEVETNAEKAARAQRYFGQQKFLADKRMSDDKREDLIRRFASEAALSRAQAGISEELLEELAQVGASDLTEIFDRVRSQRLLRQGSERDVFTRNVSAARRQVSNVIELVHGIEKRQRTAQAKADAKRSADASAEAILRANKRLMRLAEAQKNKGKDAPITEGELFKLIQTAADTGQSLTGLIGTRKIEGATPPVVAVKMTRVEVTQNIDAPVTVNGVPGEDSEELSARVLEGARELWREEVEQAIEDLTPAFAR